MQQLLLDLYEIQQIDLGIRDIERNRSQIPEHLQELEAQTDSLRADVIKLTEERDAIVKETKGLEGTIQAETIKLRKWEKRLADIRNQREYLALSREVEGTKRQNRDNEEKALELTRQQETLDEQLGELHSKLDDTEAQCEAEKKRVSDDLANLEEQVAKEKARRTTLEPKIPKALLKKYDAIRAKRMGVGLVPALNGCCQGCNMRLPPQLYNILQRVDTIEQCPSCQRIVFWEKILEKRDEVAEEAQSEQGVGATP